MEFTEVHFAGGAVVAGAPEKAPRDKSGKSGGKKSAPKQRKGKAKDKGNPKRTKRGEH